MIIENRKEVNNLTENKKKAMLIKSYNTINNDGTNTIVMVYRDENGVKKRDFVPRAMAPYYLIKDKESPEAINQPMYINRDLVEKKEVYADSLLASIAVDINMGVYLDKCRIEGKDSNDWKLVDAHDVIIHIFHPDKREFYDLEKMWSEEIPKEKAMI